MELMNSNDFSNESENIGLNSWGYIIDINIKSAQNDEIYII